MREQFMQEIVKFERKFETDSASRKITETINNYRFLNMTRSVHWQSATSSPWCAILKKKGKESRKIRRLRKGANDQRSLRY